MEIDYLKELNKAQYEATVYNDGPQLVIAGAGSGKTRVLTYKIAYLLQQGVQPYRILALTFTNKAAAEMKSRIAAIVGEEAASKLWMGTFHSIFSKILHREADKIGFTSDFTIYDAADSKSVIKSIIKEMGLDDSVYKPGNVQGKISLLKNRLVSPTSYANDHDATQADYFHKIPAFSDIYARYVKRCKESNAMDFDDLLVYTNVLLHTDGEVCAFYREKFEYILIDEYQDTNFAQHSIVNYLAQGKPHICVVGDDAQSIYSFRGANIDNILSFQDKYPGCRLFKLEQNYRSTQNIVGAANSLIEKNERQIRKRVFSKNGEGTSIELVGTFTDYDEAFTIVSKVKGLISQGKCLYSDFAVLYRTNAQSRVLEEAFRKASLPYKIYGGLSFYQRKEIKDIIAYLRLLVNKNDEEALKRIINYPARGIGETSQAKIFACAHVNEVCAYEVVRNPEAYALEVNGGMRRRLAEFASLIDGLTERVATEDAYTITEEVIKMAGILVDVAQENDVEAQSKRENIEELQNAVHEFCDKKVNEGDDEIGLRSFLSEVSLLTDQDNDKSEDREKVTLMTVHAAKGLEFRTVIVAGMEEQLFPSAMCISEREIEEERRLFYVAITRAKENCILTYAKSRFRNGQSQICRPSRFIEDIDECYLRESRQKATLYGRPMMFPHSSFGERKPGANFAKTQNEPRKIGRAFSGDAIGGADGVDTIVVGQRVAHVIFGVGTVVGIDGEGDSRKAQVDFDHHGRKQLLLKYAKLTVVEE